MTTSQTTPFLSEILQGGRISERKLAYFRARFKNRLHELVLSTFLGLEKQQAISRASLAKRLARKPEQITRWLGAPGNWELDTVSDLLLGMGYEARLSAIPLADSEGVQSSQEIINMAGGSSNPTEDGRWAASTPTSPQPNASVTDRPKEALFAAAPEASANQPAQSGVLARLTTNEPPLRRYVLPVSQSLGAHL